MNAVQIIHKHVMLRFCVVLLAVFVAFASFASTCFAEDPLGRQIAVGVGGTIGEGLGGLAGGAIGAAGITLVGLPEFAPAAAGAVGAIGGSIGETTGGFFAGKLYDFLTGYDGAADQESFDAAYSSWRKSQGNIPSYSDSDWFYYPVDIASLNSHMFDNIQYSLAFTGNFVSGSFSRAACCYGFGPSSKSFIIPFDCSYIFACPGSVFCSDDVTTYDLTYFVNNCSSSSAFKGDSVSSGALLFYVPASSSGRLSISMFIALKPASYVTDIPSFKSVIDCRAGSVSSGLSVGSALISAVGSNVTVGCIDASSVDKATKFYSIPLIDETENKLILPDGSIIELDGLTYDYATRTYNLTYDTSKTYRITYNYDNCVVNDGTAENIYYYAKVDANTPTYDKDCNQLNSSGGSGGSTTDPDTPSPDPDKPSDGGDDSGTIWDKVVDAIAGLFTAIGKVIGGLLESVINLFTGIVDGLTGCLDLFGSFGEFVAGFYSWMPEEWRTVLAAAFTIFIGLAVIKLFRGS